MPRLALLFLLLPASTLAGVVLPDDLPDHPDRTPLTVVSQEVDVRIVDQVATTTLVQVFRNDSPAPVAGTYHLPLGEQTSVQEYAFWVDGRRVVSSVAAKAAAEETFAAAARDGHDAALLASTDPNTFTARFTELAPGQTRRFEVITSELLPYEAGTVRWSHPLDYASMGLPPVDELVVRVRIEDSKPITAATLGPLPTTAHHLPDGSVEVRGGSFGEVPGQDLELTYELTSSDFGLALRTWEDGDGDGYFVAMVAPQEEAGDQDVVRKDVAFVFDVSGSMDGYKIDQARSALKACLNLMNPGDGLYLLAFNDGLDPLSNQVLTLDEATRAEATAFVDRLQAGGGTNIRDAVVDGLSALAGSDRPTALVFLTDGQGGRPASEVLAAVDAANPGDRTRIFSFGVGHDVAAPLLERLGHENRGSYTAIRGGAAIDEAVGAFYASIAKPVLTDLALDFGPDVVVNRSYPATLPDIYAGQRLVISGRYRRRDAISPDALLTVSGSIGGDARTLEVPVAFGGDEHPWVGRLWAKRRAEHLQAQIRMHGETPEAKDEIVALSTQWQFATAYTTLVAHADPRVASLTPARVKPGDPVLKIPAPAGAIGVTAFLPFGEVKELVWDAEETVWTTRFLVPRSASDGVYWIHVVVTGDDGATTWFRVSYTVDTTAPVLRAEVPPRGLPGQSLAMTARPVVGFLELGEAMIQSLGRDAAARAKAFADIKSVVARVPGTSIEAVLTSDADATPGWHGALELPEDLAPGRYRVEITATDVAGNKHTVVEPLEVLGGAVADAEVGRD